MENPKCNSTKTTSNNQRYISISTLFSSSSVFVLSRIGQSKHSLGKLFWFILLAISVGSISYKIRRFWNYYSQYPVVMSLTVQQKQSLEFPAVTVCNLNRIRYNPNGDHIGTPLIISESRSLISCKQIRNGSEPVEQASKEKLEALKEYYMMEERRRYRLGHNHSDLVANCSFGSKSCSNIRLSHFVNIRYEIGVNSGLVLKLELEQKFYSKVTHTYGGILVIHDPNELPNPEGHGLILTPGYEISVSLQQTVHRRLQSPYKDHCMEYNFKEGSFMNSKDTCVRTCMQENNFAKCHCVEKSLGVMDNLEPCNPINMTDVCCLDQVLQTMAKDGPPCKCPLPCTSVHYNEIISKAYLIPEFSKSYSRKKHFMNDTVMLKIFYSTLERHVYEQKPKSELHEFLSFIGNELGLWFGLSMIAALEILEKLGLIMKCAIGRKDFFLKRSQY
ncbi:hypothetical protein CDAR_543001 [Caerostris darwini]|uniref:Uncharacterized protein n=1 Tax=Caerostris darwini TaxID=1538125 RepID=A0AAV4X476_9ARAC|nr:hypothetical protein CDAR_543001 [Caerostris darwini]